MSTTIHWIGDVGLPENQMIIAAVPGVGNVGKLVVDTLNEQHESSMIARIIHPDLPPHSTLEDGLLVPPHLSIHSVVIENSNPVITITGNGQPMTPRGQHEVAESILQLAVDSKTPMVVVLAGLSAKPGEEHIHLTCSAKNVQDELNERGISVSTEQPSGGMLGLAGLLVSLSPMHAVSSAAYSAESVGTSIDVVTADRLAQRISADFDLGLELPIDNTRETAARLLSMMEGKEIAGIDLSEDDSGSGFYV
jgi:proteasome assembly chaperone (PAC2) family protein